MPEKDPFLLVHLADLHLAPRAATIAKIDSSTGRRVRDLDMSAALERAINDILEQDPLPSTCVIAGDIFDTYQGSHSALIDAEIAIKRLRDAGIAVVGIAGNHDTPTQALKTPAFRVLMDTFEDIVCDDGVTLAYDSIKKTIVGNVEYVLLPHSCCLHEIDIETLRPSGNAERSVLVVHGVAAGDPSLQQHDEMKEVPIKRSILEMGWDYVAFGHYHKPGWIPGYEGVAAYSGSLENTVISGPDVCMRRGPVYIDLSDEKAELVMHPMPIRHIVDLGAIDYFDLVDENDGDGDDVGADIVDDAVERQILAADTDDAIVLNKVVNIPRSVYRTMTRRSFQSVNPRMLFIRTKFEMSEDKPATVILNDRQNDDDETEQNDPLSATANLEMLPLAQEAKQMVNALISSGVIKKNNEESVIDALDGYFAAEQH